jgi:Arc/MetJ-type ribon-helix-helix transcriptional regulator
MVNQLEQNTKKSNADRLNVELGRPYTAIIDRAIEKGYAGNKSEVIRHALKAYEREINANEEAALVKKGVDDMMGKIKSGEIKTKPYNEVRKKYDLK